MDNMNVDKTGTILFSFKIFSPIFAAKKHNNRLLKEYERIGENRYTYIGSFDFKLTAIAKILDIDKGLLKDSKFIAVDLI